ncbi:hypothetical protein EYF80_017223 [Liparis tanakae]|uniref:Uncharacterized protein n=1 Tax=Liparis tanakae TaxID=230148 RepID=A0A4Z2I3G7_9TELE|nr:hypothetical protein EYF80_017223 [Liparis tanakae]
MSHTPLFVTKEETRRAPLSVPLQPITTLLCALVLQDAKASSESSRYCAVTKKVSKRAQAVVLLPGVKDYLSSNVSDGEDGHVRLQEQKRAQASPVDSFLLPHGGDHQQQAAVLLSDHHAVKQEPVLLFGTPAN